MDDDHGNSSVNFDIKRLYAAKQGITSDKITERKVRCRQILLNSPNAFLFAIEKCFPAVRTLGFEACLRIYQQQ